MALLRGLHDLIAVRLRAADEQAVLDPDDVRVGTTTA
jgi:hypothetical protein